MIVQLKIDSGKLTFDPPFRELRDILLRLLTDIVQNAEDLPRVSRKCCAGIVGSNFLVALSSHRGYLCDYEISQYIFLCCHHFT